MNLRNYVARALKFFPNSRDVIYITGTATGRLDRLPPGVTIDRRVAWDYHLLRLIWLHIIGLVLPVPLIFDETESKPSPFAQNIYDILTKQVGAYDLAAMGADLWMQGNAMAIKERDAQGFISNLIYVNPLDVTTHVVNGGLSGYTVGGDIQTKKGAGVNPGWISETPIQGLPNQYEPQDFVHIKGPPDSRSGGMLGYDRTFPALRILQNDIEQLNYQQTTLHNSGAGPIITPKDDEGIISQKDIEAAKDKLVSEIDGTRRGKPAVLTSGLEIQTVGLSPKEMLLEVIGKTTESRISSLYGMSATMLRLLVGLENSPWSHLEEAAAQEAEEVTSSICKSLGEGLSWKLLDIETGPDAQIRYDVESIRPLQEDEDKRSQRIISWIGAGIISPEHGAELLGVEFTGTGIPADGAFTNVVT